MPNIQGFIPIYYLSEVFAGLFMTIMGLMFMNFGYRERRHERPWPFMALGGFLVLHGLILNTNMLRLWAHAPWVWLAVNVAQLVLVVLAALRLTWQLVYMHDGLVYHEQTLQRTREKLESAEEGIRLRDEIFAIASHELRTPITSIKGYAQILRKVAARQGLSTQIQEPLATIDRQATKLSELITLLLDVSQLEHGKMQVHRQPTDLYTLVVRSVQELQSVTNKHTINLTASARGIVLVDPVRFDQVLRNLVQNAIRYSPLGGDVDIAIDDTHLRVRDHGIGIPPERRQKLFDRFYQAQEHEHYDGMGLGLYISKQIMELHGTRLYPEFPQDGGTCMVVELPR